MNKKSEPVSRSLRPRATSPVRPVSETFSPAGGVPEPSIRRTKTSLALDVEVYRQAKIAAIQQGYTVSEFIEKAICEALPK
ncbi:hypothetical protein GCM10022294_11780 [Dietzia aurantiaca]